MRPITAIDQPVTSVTAVENRTHGRAGTIHGVDERQALPGVRLTRLAAVNDAVRAVQRVVQVTRIEPAPARVRVRNLD